MATAYSHVGLCVTDLQRSRRFYEEVFGFRAAFEFGTDGPDTATLLRLEGPLRLDALYLALDGLLLELLAFDRLAPATSRVLNEPGLTHLSLFVDDLDAVRAAVPACGGTVREDTNVGPALFVEDPDGQAIEVIGPGGRFRDLRERALRDLEA
ncbi:MAG TPA: VOC family protein [Acidimicrobiales bacterium]|jgi:catechol 2,3-dioxygenase-like lactoylglutathione lyase family enzyme|nr:VOC family protein [Acidimicrobiales bacterium]